MNNSPAVIPNATNPISTKSMKAKSGDNKTKLNEGEFKLNQNREESYPFLSFAGTETWIREIACVYNHFWSITLTMLCFVCGRKTFD